MCKNFICLFCSLYLNLKDQHGKHRLNSTRTPSYSDKTPAVLARQNDSQVAHVQDLQNGVMSGNATEAMIRVVSILGTDCPIFDAYDIRPIPRPNLALEKEVFFSGRA